MAASFALEPYLASQKARVEAALVELMELRSGHVPEPLLEAMRYSLLDGGKRLRPILCLAFAEAVAAASGGSKRALDAACAVEMVHCYSLVHDDLPAMDDDDLRRGKPTSHKRFGEAMAILAGDALLTAAFETIPGDLAWILAVAAGPAGMIAGQVIDVAEDRPAEIGFLTRMHALKTGALIRASCELGAIAGGANEQQRRAAADYGDRVGLAFQIADDVLDHGEEDQATFSTVLGVDRARSVALEAAANAVEAIRMLEPRPGPLAAIAGFAANRKA